MDGWLVGWRGDGCRVIGGGVMVGGWGLGVKGCMGRWMGGWLGGGVDGWVASAMLGGWVVGWMDS